MNINLLCLDKNRSKCQKFVHKTKDCWVGKKNCDDSKACSQEDYNGDVSVCFTADRSKKKEITFFLDSGASGHIVNKSGHLKPDSPIAIDVAKAKVSLVARNTGYSNGTKTTIFSNISVTFT